MSIYKRSKLGPLLMTWTPPPRPGTLRKKQPRGLLIIKFGGIRMSSASLLAVVEVPVDDRVRCQAPGCNHTVYKRIHVVRIERSLRVLGSTCFEKLFKGQAIARESPRFTQSNGRELTEAERALLVQNTEQLIAHLEAAYEKALRDSNASQPTPKLPPTRHKRRGFSTRDHEVMDPLLEAEAKRRVREKHGVDPDQPGWRGLVLVEAQAIKDENAA